MANPRMPSLQSSPISNDEKSTAELIRELLENTQQLFRNEVALARTEVKAEWSKARAVLHGFTVAYICFGLAAFFLGFTAVEFLVELEFSRSLSSLIVATASLGVGAAVYWGARKDSKAVDFIPRQTIQSIKETIPWTNQTR